MEKIANQENLKNTSVKLDIFVEFKPIVCKFYKVTKKRPGRFELNTRLKK